MDIGAIIIIILIGIILVLTFYTIGVYNALLDAKNKVKDKFSQIDIELINIKKIINTLLEVLKKHTKHEEKLLKEIEKVLEDISKENTINEKISVYHNANKVIKKVLKLEDTYPELKTNKKVITIKKEIKEIEEKIYYAKDIYNNAVEDYNSKRKDKISNIISKIFKFEEINKLK